MASPHPRHALLLLAALAALPAAALDPAQHGGGAACLAGDCDNGEGTIRSDDGNEYTGIWSGGRFTDGRTYRVRYGFEPSHTTELVFNAQGKPVSGTLLRGNPHTGSGTVGTFTGTFSTFFNPILNQNMTTYQQGRYTDTIGRIYDGEFSYLPMRKAGLPTGTFIFQGVRIDDEADEVIRDLFISDPAPAGFAIKFRRARPDYLVKLQQEYESDKVQAVADARVASQQAEDARQSSNNMASILGVMGGLLAVGGGGGGKLGGLQSSTLSALTGGISGKQTSSAILSGVLSQVMQQAGNDPTLARSIGDTSSPTSIISALSGLGSTGRSMTRSQYAAQMLAGAATSSGSTGSPVVDALGQAVINRTQNTITSALAGSGSGARGAVSLLQAVVAGGARTTPSNALVALPATPVPVASGSSADKPTGHGTVMLHLTPGKGILDPVTGQFVRQIDQLSCDNVTSAGRKLRDLPAGQRMCADTGTTATMQ